MTIRAPAAQVVGAELEQTPGQRAPEQAPRGEVLDQPGKDRDHVDLHGVAPLRCPAGNDRADGAPR
jgi:hypothetical protein